MPQYAASQLACPREPESSNEPYPPCPAPRACRRAAPAASGDQGPRGTLLGVVTLGYSDQLVGAEAIAAITVGPTCPLTSPQTARAAAIITTARPPRIMAATTSALPARI